jgi:hypothetical protein
MQPLYEARVARKCGDLWINLFLGFTCRCAGRKEGTLPEKLPENLKE